MNLPGVLVCASLHNRVCLMFTVFAWFVSALLCDVVCFVVVLFCLCLCTIRFKLVFACFVCGILYDGVWLVVRFFVLCLCVMLYVSLLCFVSVCLNVLCVISCELLYGL